MLSETGRCSRGVVTDATIAHTRSTAVMGIIDRSLYGETMLVDPVDWQRRWVDMWNAVLVLFLSFQVALRVHLPGL